MDLSVAFLGTGIMGSHMARHLSAAGFDVPLFAKLSEGFSGRQIMRAWNRAMTTAFKIAVPPEARCPGL